VLALKIIYTFVNNLDHRNNM